MAISAECPKCRNLNAVERAKCSKCGAKIGRGCRYWLRYRINGISKKESLGAISLSDARLMDLQRTTQVKVNQRNKVDTQLTWADLGRRYVDKLVAERASGRYVNDSKTYFERMQDFFGNGAISGTTPALIKEFRTQLRTAGLSEATCDRHLAAGKAAWNYCVDDIKNPFERVKNFNPENEVVRFLTDDERERLLEAAFNTHRALFEMLIVSMSTGMRKSNVLNLRRSEVDFETGMIVVTQKGGLVHQSIMNDSCRSILVAVPENATDYFWITQHGTPYRVDWRKPWEKAKRLAGIPDEFRWHDLRHDAGTRLFSATGDIYSTQKFLGHRQTKTTARYAHFLREKLQAAADALNVPCPTRVLRVVKNE